MKRYILAAAAAAFTVMGSAQAFAAGLGFDARPAGGGSQQVYALGNGNYLGLWGFSGGVAAQIGNALNTADLKDDFGLNKNSIVGFYYADPTFDGMWAGNPDEFEAFGATFSIASASNNTNYSDRLFDSFWVEWTGGRLFNAAGNSNMAASATLQGDPLAPIPLPAAAWLLMAGVAGLGAMSRRRKSA